MHATARFCHAIHHRLAGARFILPCRRLGVLGLCAWASTMPAAEPQAMKTRTIPELKAFFEQNCTRCHGPDGSAHAPDGKKLGGLDFTQTAMHFRALGSPASEREIQTMARSIRKGLFFGLTMPGWKDQLSQEEATLMVREVLLKAEPGIAIRATPVQTGQR